MMKNGRRMHARRVQIIAHRGASAAARENTVAAFLLAREHGADAVELDVRACSDGTLVVHHDAHLADGRAIAELTAAELPSDVPTLEAALDACAGMWVNVEIKHGDDEPGFHVDRLLAVSTAAALIARPEPSDRFVVSSFDLATIDTFRLCAPQIATAWLVIAPEPGTPAALAAAGHRALHPFFAFVTEELLADCRAHGIAVNTWTCDDPERMTELARWGVSGICTNVPDVAIATLRP
jgi:glycerophosphoryl diester phosphodiesterase